MLYVVSIVVVSAVVLGLCDVAGDGNGGVGGGVGVAVGGVVCVDVVNDGDSVVVIGVDSVVVVAGVVGGVDVVVGGVAGDGVVVVVVGCCVGDGVGVVDGIGGVVYGCDIHTVCVVLYMYSSQPNRIQTQCHGDT